MIKRVLNFGMVLLTVTIFLTSSGQFWVTEASAKELILSVTADMEIFDPAHFGGSIQKSAAWLIFESLYQFDEDMNLKPVLAKDFPEISPDGTEYTVSLKKGVKFHDGSAFNSEVVKWGMARLMADKDPVYGKPSRYRALVNMVKSVEALDEHTVKIKLNFPYQPFIYSFAHGGIFFQSKVAAEKLGTDIGLKPSGTGPFMLKEWVKGDHMVMVRNPNYWGKEPWADKITIRVIPEDSVRLMALEVGEIDVAPVVPVIYVDRLKKNKDIKIQFKPSITLIYAAPLTKSGPTSDIRVRKALNYAADKDSVVNKLLKGYAKVATGPSAPGAAWYKKCGVYPYDPKKARDLLKQAGYPEGITLKALAPASMYWQMHREMMSAYVASMKNAGITLNVDYVEYATWRSIVYDPESLIKRGYNLGFASWSPGTGDTAYTLSSLLHTRGGGYGRFNSGGYSNKEVDQLIENARSAKSSKEAGNLLGKAQQIIFDEAALLFLHYDPNVFAYRSNVEGVGVTPNGIMLWGYAKKE